MSRTRAERIGFGRHDELDRELLLRGCAALMTGRFEIPIYPVGDWILSIREGLIFFYYDRQLLEVHSLDHYATATDLMNMLLAVERRGPDEGRDDGLPDFDERGVQ